MTKMFSTFGTMADSVEKSKLNKDIITGTLDAVNSYSCNKPGKLNKSTIGASKDANCKMQESYDFNKTVLSAESDRGNIFKTKS